MFIALFENITVLDFILSLFAPILPVALWSIREARRHAEATERANRLVEFNVIESVYNLCKTSIVQNAWKNGQNLGVHGWVYSLKTGLITDMKVSAYDNENLDGVFKFK